MNTRLFIELYMAALRAVVKKPVPSPRKGSARYEALDRARQLVDKLGGDYADYIRVQFEAYRFMRTSAYPKPESLVSVKAIERFKGWQRRHNKYAGNAFTLDGDSFIVNSTGKVYPLRNVLMGTADDILATFAIDVSKMAPSKNTLKAWPINKVQEAWEAVEYMIAKLEYKRKEPTKSLLEVRENLKEERVPF